MKRYPVLKILGILTILIALFLTIITGGLSIMIGAVLVGFAIVLFILNYVSKNLKGGRFFWLIQITISIVYISYTTLTYLDWSKYDQITFSDDFNGTAGIIFGIEGYPELPKMRYWVRNIDMPESGIIVTSSSQESLENKYRFRKKDGSTFHFDSLDFKLSEYPCIVSSDVLKYYQFQIGYRSSNDLQYILANLCDSINSGHLTSLYNEGNNPVVRNANKPYILLQDKNLSALPENIKDVDVQEIILTGNNFTEIPDEVKYIPHLKELLIGHNPITKLPDDLISIANLERLVLNKTEIEVFPDDMSILINLKSIGLNHNGYDSVPKGILTIPNLERLRLNNNNLTSMKFIDKRLHKLKSLYLDSNSIPKLECSISHLENLEELQIFANDIDSIPDCIATLKNLKNLQIWNNPISYVSPEIQKLDSLKYLRMDAEFLSDDQQEQIRNWLPNCEIYFQ